MKPRSLGISMLIIFAATIWADTTAFSAERRGPADRQRRLDSDVQRADMRQHRLKRLRSLDNTGKPDAAVKSKTTTPKEPGN